MVDRLESLLRGNGEADRSLEPVWAESRAGKSEAKS